MAGAPKGKPHRRYNKPTIITKLLNERTTHTENKAEPKPLAKIPDPPKSLGKEARAEWNRITKILLPFGLVTELDVPSLVLYCDAFATYNRANEELNKKGQDIVMTGKNGGKYRNIWYEVRKKSGEDMSKYMALFGLSPGDRSRLKSKVPDPSKAPKNDFDDLD